MGAREDWTGARDALVRAVSDLGFPPALGEAAARLLGSPRAMERMTKYLYYARPNTAEELADEVLAIRSEIDAWRARKASRQASAGLNEDIWEDEEEEAFDKGGS